MKQQKSNSSQEGRIARGTTLIGKGHSGPLPTHVHNGFTWYDLLVCIPLLTLSQQFSYVIYASKQYTKGKI